MKDSIRNRLIKTFVSLALIPLLFLGGILTWQNYAADVKQVKYFQQKIAAQQASIISNIIHEQENKILSLLLRNYLPGMSKTEIEKAFSIFLSASKDRIHGDVFDQIVFLDEKGKAVVSVSRTIPSWESNLRDWMESTDFIVPSKPSPDNDLRYSLVHFIGQTGEPLLRLSIPVWDLRTPELRGMVVTEMKLNFLWHLIADMEVGRTGVAYITDSDGRVIGHPDRSIILKETYFDPPRQASIMNGLNGRKSVIASEEIKFGDHSLFFTAEVPTDEALKHIYTSVIIVCSFLVMTLLGAGLLVFTVVRNIVQPIEALSATAKSISNGNYQLRAKKEPIVEFEDLAIAFNSMTSRLNETINDLEREMHFVETVIESLTHPFYVIDVNDYTVKLANSAANFGDLTGASKCHELTHRSETPCGGCDHPCTIDEVIKTNRPVVLEHRHCFNGISPKSFEVYGYPIRDHEGRITQVIEYNVDITERKDLEDQLRQAQKLEAIGSLASGVAHDFNNHLTAILGYGELLRMSLPDGDPAKERAKSICEAGMRASNLTRQLLAFSRKQMLEMKVLNLNYLIDNMAKMMGRLIGEHIEIKMFLKSSAGNIKADAGQIEQVLMNLAINARDAMPGGGSLMIETDTVELDEKYCSTHAKVSPGRYVMLGVTDTGTGMSAETIEKIFEPFFTTKEKGYGTGLGLATVYGIVRQHKGFIYVYSELNCGTTFKVYLPEVQERAEELVAKELPVMLEGSETILVVDDEPSIRQLVIDTMQPLGYKVIDAGSGMEALECHKEFKREIDLLLADVIMPGMSGRELAEKLAAERPSMKVLYMSGYTDNVIAHQGVLEPGIFFINKPVIPSLLTKKIREVLDSD